ncbi:MAG: cytochrome c biogenesis protein CcdA [Spirosomataceae bacterium]
MKNLFFHWRTYMLGVGVWVMMACLPAFAQIQTPVKWTFSMSKEQVKVGETVDLLFTATIDKGWHIFSTDQNPDVGPIPSEIKLIASKDYQLVGKIQIPANVVKKQDEIFGGEVRILEGKGVFKQTVKILKANPVIEGKCSSQACQDDGVCIPPKSTEFKFEVKTIAAAETPASDPKLGNTATPDTKTADASAQAGSLKEEQVAGTPPVLEEKKETTPPVSESTPTPELTAQPEEGSINGSLWGFAIAAFLSGLLALLTPCVFPMIPMTVSYFTKRSHSRAEAITRASVYGLSIILIYTLIGTIVARLNGPAFANFLSTHWVPNLLFFVIFVVFGLSFLGWFEIVLPHSLVNKVDAQADRGGWAGIFFMAFTIVLVSFSCTGPIVGSILVASAGGEVVKPIIGMVAFSSAFAIPFALFAMFPQWLKGLPKSGGWLNSVKVVLGFIELALALKFLSTADQVYHWRLLDREVYLAFWVVIFALIGFYLLGKIRLPHDSKTESVSVPRMILAICTFAFVVYMIPGLFGAPLKMLSGYLPPLTTQDFALNASGGGAETAATLASSKVRHSEIFKLPHGLQGYFDYKEALAKSQQEGKPLFIDFTGHGCVNCRKMEEYVWSNPEVLKRLRNDFIVVALYVDDKTELPQNEWYKSKYDGEEKRSIGDQNADLQIVKFNNNAQPYYCLVDANGNLLKEPVAYNTDVLAFVRFLDEGKAKFAATTSEQKLAYR